MTVNEYLKLPYHYVFVPRHKQWHVEVQEFKGCFVAHAPTLQIAYKVTKDFLERLIEDLLERGLEIPLPKED